jgi:hypothetical protein
MEKKKKTWAEPKLTALVRRKPEEDILRICKVHDGQAGDGGAFYVGCIVYEACWKGCQTVQTS